MKTFGELLRQSWHVYTTQFHFFLWLVLMLVFPLLLLMDFIPGVEPQQGFGAELFANGVNGQVMLDWLSQYYFVIEPGYIWYAIAVQAVLWVASFVVVVAAVSGVARAVSGQRLDMAQELQRNKDIVLPALLSSVLATVLSSVLFLAGIIPGIIASYFWVFVVPAVVLSGQRYWAALRYSTDLVRGNWWDVFFKVIGATVIVGVITAAFIISVAGVIMIPGIGAVVEGVIQIASLFVTVFLTVMYMDYQALDMLKQMGVDPAEVTIKRTPPAEK